VRRLDLIQRIFESSEIAKVCLVVLAIQMALLVVLFSIHCLNAFIEMTVMPYRQRRKELFERAIERILLESIHGGPEKPWSLPDYYWFEAGTLRDIIFLYLIEFKGDAKARLFTLYASLGFFNIDVKKLSSKRWWRRLNGATRLQHIGVTESEQALHVLFDDPHPFIANVINKHFGKMEGR
jgi:hypothetical protein